MKSSISIHGHFYQPPRTDPFTGKDQVDSYVLDQTGGKYSNWNKIITDQCYKPNADLGNFSLISFDLYRSLAEWLEINEPTVYSKIIQNDQIAYQNDGFGSALCGSWDHAILPLLSAEDKELEVYWGYHDHIKRFGHEPVGFWLAETAVSFEVLDILAKNGLRLVVLAPWQASNPIDTTKIYFVSLKEGRRICVAFYDKLLSDNLSFNSLAMGNADQFAKDYIASRSLRDSQVLLGATDGERYGHHLKEGENFLHRLLTTSTSDLNISPTTILKAFAQTSPKDEAFIKDNTSWSCLCGDLKRWKQDCECCVDYDRNNSRVSGQWKAILFNSINTMSQNLVAVADNLLSKLLINPTEAKKEYIHVHLHTMTESEFLSKHQRKPLDAQEISTVMNACKMQLYRLAAFTSCGWFFSELDRPEPRIVIGNMKKALSLLADLGHVEHMMNLEKAFTAELSNAKSNFTGKNGKDLYLEYQSLLG